MGQLLDQDWVSLAGGVVFLAACWMVFKSVLRRGESHRSTLHVTAFCVHCGWEGRVVRSAWRCGRCRSADLTVVAT